METRTANRERLRQRIDFYRNANSKQSMECMKWDHRMLDEVELLLNEEAGLFHACYTIVQGWEASKGEAYGEDIELARQAMMATERK